MKNKKPKRKNLEIEFYEGILRDDPDFINVLANLGDAYTRKGFYDEGLEVDRKICSLTPEAPIAQYNLACSFSILGEVYESLEALKKAVLFGYSEFDYILEDPDLNNLRQLPEFKVFFSKVNKVKI